MREVELKAVVPDVSAARQRLADAGALVVFEGALIDRRYDTPSRTLTARDEVLRLRVQRNAVGERAVVEFKGHASIVDGYKIREETGASVGDAAAFAAILASLGYEVTREIDRDVSVFVVEGATVRLERYGAYAAVFYSAILAMVFAYMFWYRGLRILGPTRTAVYSNLQPVIAAIVAYFAFREVPTGPQLIGATCVISGLLLTRR